METKILKTAVCVEIEWILGFKKQRANGNQMRHEVYRDYKFIPRKEEQVGDAREQPPLLYLPLLLLLLLLRGSFLQSHEMPKRFHNFQTVEILCLTHALTMGLQLLKWEPLACLWVMMV